MKFLIKPLLKVISDTCRGSPEYVGIPQYVPVELYMCIIAKFAGEAALNFACPSVKKYTVDPRAELVPIGSIVTSLFLQFPPIVSGRKRKQISI